MIQKHHKVLSSQSGNRLCHGRKEIIRLEDSPESRGDDGAKPITSAEQGARHLYPYLICKPQPPLDTIFQESGTEIDYSLVGELRKGMSDMEVTLSACIGITSTCEYFTSCQAQHLDSDRCYDNPIGCNVREFYRKWSFDWEQMFIGSKI